MISAVAGTHLNRTLRAGSEILSKYPSLFYDKVKIAARRARDDCTASTILNNHGGDNELDYEQMMGTVLWKIRKKIRFWP